MTNRVLCFPYPCLATQRGSAQGLLHGRPQNGSEGTGTSVILQIGTRAARALYLTNLRLKAPSSAGSQLKTASHRLLARHALGAPARKRPKAALAKILK
jgi:hypothetical protein